jgi:hypothetical protein
MAAVTELHRKSLVRLMSESLERQPRCRQRGRTYGPEVNDALRIIAESLDYICADRRAMYQDLSMAGVNLPSAYLEVHESHPYTRNILADFLRLGRLGRRWRCCRNRFAAEGTVARPFGHAIVPAFWTVR